MRLYNKYDILEKTSGNVMREELLNTLIELDKFCKEHDLHYCLSGGTLLGAIRHHGFIPWDDDIDVNMPRSDCEKLMELSGGKIGDMILCPPNCTNEYHAYHWKLYNERILVKKPKGKKIYPIFIDIFPIEGLPDTPEKTAKHYKKIRFWKDQADVLWSAKEFYGRNILAKLYHGLIARPFAKIWGREKVFERVIGVMKEIPYDSSDYVGVMATKVHTTEERVVKSEFMTTIEVDFEGHKFPGPAGYDIYLRQLYGDNYMELPPVEKRVSNHSLIPYRSKMSQPDYKPTINVAICGLIKSANLGEQFIARSLEYLIDREMHLKGIPYDLNFIEVDLLGRKDKTYITKGYIRDHIMNYAGYSLKGFPVDAIYNKLMKFATNHGSMGLKNVIYRFRHFLYRHCRNYEKRLMKYYRKKMKYCDFIVVDGAGLLEYSYNEYQESLNLISKYAKMYNRKVIYNAIGRAGAFDERDFRSTILKSALQADVVRYVSARDSVETVQICAGKDKQVKLLADAAFWMKETYEPVIPEERKKVGIGLIRGNSLLGYGVQFGSKDWVNLFVGIAEELKRRGYEFEFFTNGLPGDIVLGRKILSQMNLPAEYLVRRPTQDVELYDTINQYCGMVTCRMHSAIAAFTLGIPSVILSWNDKVNKLMEHIGYPERAIDLENFDPVYIVDSFERCLKEGVSEEKQLMMKAKAQESVDDYVEIMIDAIAEVQPEKTVC